MDSGQRSSVPAWFAGFQAFENRFIFPEDGEVNGGEPSRCVDVQNRHRGTSFRLVRIVISTPFGTTKNRHPGQGTSGVMLVVPPHFVTALRSATSTCAAAWCCGCCDTVVRVTGNLTRRRLLGIGSIRVAGAHECVAVYRMFINPVRDEARRAFSPVFPVPLLSCRGSLFRFDRLLVLVNACRVRMSATTVADSLPSVNSLVDIGRCVP